jgi:aryl-alcohol dehydrogenase-like predicted oxidoreductase
MEFRKLGASDVNVTPIAFGAWAIGGWMWGGAEETDGIRALRTACDIGMTTIDTAPVYGFGRSEEIIGKAMSGVRRDSYQILTKFGLSWETNEGEYFFDTASNEGKPLKIYKYSGGKKVIKECEDSMKRLKTDYIDLLQIHWPDNTTSIAETMEAVALLIKQGKVRAAGVCNYNVEQVDEALRTLKIVSNQLPYSMINRTIEKDLVPQAIKNNMGILPYSPLQRGLLTGKIKRDHTFNDGDTREGNRFYTAENIDLTNAFLQKIKSIADEHQATLSQLVLNWTAHQLGVVCVLAGARNEQQVKDNAKAMNFKLSSGEIKEITMASDRLALRF